MCNSENHKCNRGEITLSKIPLCLLIIGILASASFAQPTSVNDKIIIRTPNSELNSGDVFNLFEEARISASLRRGEPLSFKQLSSYTDRYRVLVEQLQARFIGSQMKGTIDPKEIEGVVHNLSAGLPLHRALVETTSSVPSQQSERALFRRYNTSKATMGRAIKLELKKLRLVDALLAELPPEYMLINWFEQSLEVEFEAVTIPRVPTTREIDRAVVQLKQEISSAYAQSPGRFNKSPKILATRVRVPWVLPRTSQSDASVRQRASALRRQRESGAELSSVLKASGDSYGLRKGGHVTLNARKYSQLARLNKGDRSPVVEDDRGVGFYEIKMHAPAFTRLLSEDTVQRELAAELLRESDTLPTAYSLARSIADSWVSQPNLIAARIATIQGARRIPSSRFAPFASALIPGIGTSEAGSAHLKMIQRLNVSENPLPIRQDYVVFRVTDWDVPDLNTWWEKAPEFWAGYAPKARRQILHQWITKNCPKSSIEVDAKVIAQMDL